MKKEGLPSEDASVIVLLDKLKEIKPLIGNSPVRKLKFKQCNLFAKLEFNNHSGSVKDWPAYFILQSALEEGLIDPDTVIIESSSGNFALALAYICKRIGLTFIPVIDPNINKDYKIILEMLCERVVMVKERDDTGGYLLTRIARVNSLCQEYYNSYWPNQYDNENNYKAYYNGLGPEIACQFTSLDFIFVAVSSCGTITGLSRYLKKVFPEITVIAVDVEGSVIFGQPPAQRFVSGIGASKVPGILKHALIDSVIHISQTDLLIGCQQLVDEQVILAGASSGSIYYAVKKYFEFNHTQNSANALFVVPDSGKAYLDTIYNPVWRKMIEKRTIKAPLDNIVQ